MLTDTETDFPVAAPASRIRGRLAGLRSDGRRPARRSESLISIAGSAIDWEFINVRELQMRIATLLYSGLEITINRREHVFPPLGRSR